MRISDWSSDVCSSDLVPSLWRILVPAREGEDDETLLSDAKKNRVFAGLLGDDRPITTYHRTLYRVHQRVAHDFRKGRVILAGDAAHLNNPLGGFGMNSGIPDAWNITAKPIGRASRRGRVGQYVSN